MKLNRPLILALAAATIVAGRFYHIQQGERPDKHLQFMYKPVMHTLQGLEDHSITISNEIDVSKIPYNSTFVWVGVFGLHTVPWRNIRARGIRTVYYQTEPEQRCVLTTSTVDEIWDFSWYNIKNCEGKHEAPVLRYVPIARQDWVVPTVVPNLAANTLEFFGQKFYRGVCFAKIDMRWKIKAEYNTWNELDFKRYLQHSSGIFLNIHKGCASTGPVTFRNSLLLSTNGVVISSRCHELDEKMYKGHILFVDSIADITHALVKDHIRSRNVSRFFKDFNRIIIIQNAGLR